MILQFFMDYWSVIVSGSRALALGFLAGTVCELFAFLHCLWTGEEF